MLPPLILALSHLLDRCVLVGCCARCCRMQWGINLSLPLPSLPAWPFHTPLPLAPGTPPHTNAQFTYMCTLLLQGFEVPLAGMEEGEVGSSTTPRTEQPGSGTCGCWRTGGRPGWRPACGTQSRARLGCPGRHRAAHKVDVRACSPAKVPSPPYIGSPTFWIASSALPHAGCESLFQTAGAETWDFLILHWIHIK